MKPIITIKDYVAYSYNLLENEFSKLKNIELDVIQVGDNMASTKYINGKKKDAEKVGVKFVHHKFSETITEKELLKFINRLNKNRTVSAIMVQMPLPDHISEEAVKLAIAPEKDVDGFNPLSKVSPCTPAGIMDYLEFCKYDLTGKNALVIGRSNIVGKPMARLLLDANANVTVIHSKTSESDFKKYVKSADIIVVAVGKKYMLDNHLEYKPSAWIIDVGINRGEDNFITGDCEKDLKVEYQSPVPGGVGLLTRMMVYKNLYKLITK